MKIKTFLVRSFTVAAGLCAASNLVNAAPKATFTDSWKDTAVQAVDPDTGDTNYVVKTTGSLSFSISLPGIVGANFNPNTLVSLAITLGANGPQTVFTNALLDDTNYTAGKKSVSLPILMADGTPTVSKATVGWNATNITVTGSATSDLLGGELLFTNTVKSNFTVGGLVLTVDTTTGADGNPNPNGSVTILPMGSQEVPLSEKNTTTLYTKTNADGSYTPLQAGSIAATVDFTPPTVSITSPAANAKFQAASPVVSLAGKASDKYGLASIVCYVNGDLANPIDINEVKSLPTTNSSSFSWTASVNLTNGAAGTNKITVVVMNTLGDTGSASRNFILVVTNKAMVVVSPAGAGTITGIKNNQVLQGGNNYAVTAKPANAYWIFSQWVDGTNDAGTFLSGSASFEYLNVDDMLTAVFVPNPFYDTGLAGTYVGMFTDTSSQVDPTNSGYITLTVTPAGGYSGKLYLGQSASSFALSGQLTVSGTSALASSTVKISKTESLDVSLSIVTDTDLQDQTNGTLSGEVASKTWSATLSGELAQANPDIVPGLYNVVISPHSDATSGPGGYSYASATVKNGAVTMVFNLADGTSPATSFSTFLTESGVCPVYASLYGGKGILFGALQFASDGTRTVTNASELSWVKWPMNNKFYTNGFNYTPAYTPAVFGNSFEQFNIFDWTAGNLSVDQNTAIGPFSITFNPLKNTLVDTNKADKVTLNLTASTGVLKGTVGGISGRGMALSPSASIPSAVDGTDGVGYGFYLGTNQQTGQWVIQGGQ